MTENHACSMTGLSGKAWGAAVLRLE